MPKLSQIQDRPIAIDLRVGLPDAATLYARWANHSLWPDDPFGASADERVWPRVFVERDLAARDRIALDPGEAPYWDAYYMWDNVREMTNHMRPLPVITNAIALGLDRDPNVHLRHDYALAGLAENGVSSETLEMEAAFMGYDITDGILESSLFMSELRGFDASDVSRSVYGLVDSLEAARKLRDRLDRYDPSFGPLSCISVWALGERPATPLE